MKFNRQILTAAVFLSAATSPSTVVHASSFSPTEMVVSANNLATDAGKRVLAMGGTAVDAMVAVQTVLGLVEPQSSGIGGGAFCVYYDAENDRLTTFDGREKAPGNATEERFQLPDGTYMDFLDAWQSALSVGVPGVPRLMEDLHMRYGKLEWPTLFEDAKDLATNGYEQTGRTVEDANEIFAENESCESRLFFRDDVAFAYYYDTETCMPKPEGTVMTNPDYADTLDLLATGGADAFYTGPMAEDIVAKVAADRNPTGDAIISLEDLANYEIIEREPVCKLYRGMHNVCGMGPPSSGALAVGQILGVLNEYNITEISSDRSSLDVVHLFTQAMRLAFADRNLYVGDADFITVPVDGMLDQTYLAERSQLIDPMQDMGTAEPGTPPGTFDPSAPQTVTNEGGTSHIAIVDQFGNALSMTTTVESYFGSGLMVRGFLLNNQITDFSFEPVDPATGLPIANRCQPNKRPRSSMSPTIVMDNDTGDVTYLAGSPGGSRIIGYTSQALMAMLDYGVDPQTAANSLHYQNRNGDTEIETVLPEDVAVSSETDTGMLISGLESYGHVVVERGGEESGLSLIKITDEGLLGGADPRRDGSAGGRTSAPSMSPVAGGGDGDGGNEPSMAPGGDGGGNMPSSEGMRVGIAQWATTGIVALLGLSMNVW